ncbi:flagellar biosynthesis protein FlgN [Marinibacterium profundimaris]|uniref:Flagellar biosynthesis protein FlgN n=1 Tax=Marinibacterium profundimaris TaxID=1679460 RepID=A0A225NSS1_9RHOB|nr:flagellar biosynthesis protein FlgN [Marinibacterium profundimaris]OWU75868.1 flagellar biosynthesis protein FlgN [Marinibacterium profundimaris]
MSRDKIDSLIEELDQLLDAERRALVSGELEELARLHDTKERLVSGLSTLDRMEAAELKDLRDKMTRNQALLDSAMEGIRSVAERMAELRRLRQSLSTYDRDGKRRQYETPTEQKLEKRA